MSSKKLPPFGKPLNDIIKSGYIPNNDVNLFIGNHAWKKGENFFSRFPERTLILPPWHDPSDYNWPVKVCDVLIFDTGYAEEDYLTELAKCLYESNASIVRMVSPNFELSIYYKD